jgi:hypothetical protein
MLDQADVSAIVAGYKATPSLLVDGLRWWHGPWIEQGIQVFRPLASYLLWVECWLGLNHGFEAVAWIGFALFLSVCLACSALTWRLTRAPLLVYLCATLAATTQRHVMGATQPKYWLSWFPVHHDLLFILALVGALFFFDCWLEGGRKQHLILTWVCFVTGILVKEYAYLFPLLAALWAWGRAGEEMRGRAWKQVVFFFGLALALFTYRTLVLPDPYNPPPLKIVHFMRKPWMYWLPPFYRYMSSGIYWIPGLALMLVVVADFWRRALRQEKVKLWLKKPFATSLAIAATLLLLHGYIWVSTGAPLDSYWHMLEPKGWKSRFTDLVSQIFLIYVLMLIWRARKERMGMMALGLLVAIYLPVFTYLGWHYCLAGWYVRAAIWWPTVAFMVARDWGWNLARPLKLS